MSKKQIKTKQDEFAKAISEILKSQLDVEQPANINVELNKRLRAIVEELEALAQIDPENRGCIMLFVDKAQCDDGKHKNISLISGYLQNVEQCYVNLLKNENMRRMSIKHVLGI